MHQSGLKFWPEPFLDTIIFALLLQHRVWVLLHACCKVRGGQNGTFRSFPVSKRLAYGDVMRHSWLSSGSFSSRRIWPMWTGGETNASQRFVMACQLQSQQHVTVQPKPVLIHKSIIPQHANMGLFAFCLIFFWGGACGLLSVNIRPFSFVVLFLLILGN